jgi:hypothetical protein
MMLRRCSCDRAIVACINRVPLQRGDFVRWGMQAAIRAYFSSTACRCPDRSWALPVQQSLC